MVTLGVREFQRLVAPSTHAALLIKLFLNLTTGKHALRISLCRRYRTRPLTGRWNSACLTVDIVDEDRRVACEHIVRVASLRWSWSVHGDDHVIDLRGWRNRRSNGIDGLRW
jgi:hypothetical protein